MIGMDSKPKEPIQRRTWVVRASDARFHNVVTISSDGIVIVDGFGMILFVNPAAKSLFGRQAEQLLGEQFGFPIVAGETTELDIANRQGKQAIVEMRVVATEWEGKPAYLATLRDITERRNAEQELRTLYSAMMQGPAIVMITDAEGIIKYVNPKFTETTGYTPAEVMGKNPGILSSGKTPPEEYKKMWEAITGGHEWQGEFINRKKNGELYHEAVSIAPVTDSEGTITHFVAVKEDITERKLLEAEIQDAREYAENIVETVREPLVVLNADLKILTANQSFYDTFKATPEETIGNFIYDLGNRQWDIPKLRVLFEEILPHDTVFNGYEVEHDFPDIGRKIIRLNARQIFRKNIGSHIILLAMEDITERKRAEEARNQLSVIVERSLNEIYLFDVETLQFKHANQGALKNILYSLEDLKKLTPVDIQPELTETSFRTMIQPLLADEQDVLVFETVHRRADGSLYPVEVHLQVVGAGQQRTFLAVIFDVTERKHLEAEKAKFEDKYHQLQKTESLGRMAGAIAHNYNNLLGVVMGNLELGMDNLPPGAQIITFMTEAMKAARRAADVSGLMLTYLGQGSGEKELVDLSEVCSRSLPILREVMPTEVEMEVDIPSPGPTIKANAREIQQCLTNLATNALEALGEGRGTIHLAIKTVSPADIPVTHRFPLDWQPQDALYACLEVRDTGNGIAEEVIDKLFDPFFTTKFTGRGLGLPVILGIARAHHGGITVESVTERGSTFRVFFPVSG